MTFGVVCMVDYVFWCLVDSFGVDGLTLVGCVGFAALVEFRNLLVG